MYACNVLNLSHHCSCWSHVGRIGSKQLLSLAPDCWRHGIVVHEIGRSDDDIKLQF